MRRAFTLVEMLLVLIIITILAFLLVPVFQKTRRAALQTKCLSNIRQVGAAMELYRLAYDAWPWGRRSVNPDHPEWPDPTASLAALYPAYASKMFLFQCPADPVKVLIAADGRDFANCRNFGVPPAEVSVARREPIGPCPKPPSYFYDGGWPHGAGIPKNAAPTRVVYGDRCVEAAQLAPGERWQAIGRSNHEGGGNFLFLDGHVEWLAVQWSGRGLPSVPNRYKSPAGRYGITEDTCVFTTQTGVPAQRLDADLAGMTWTDAGWVEH